MELVTCPSCSATVASGAKFCAECGTPTALQCSVCDSAAKPGQKFCGNCGGAIGVTAQAEPAMARASTAGGGAGLGPTATRLVYGKKYVDAQKAEQVEHVGRRAGAVVRTEDVFAEQGKSPGLAAFLSVLFVGAGQFYNGDWKKGAALLLGGVVLGAMTAGLAWIAIALFACHDAYVVAKGERPIWKGP